MSTPSLPPLPVKSNIGFRIEYRAPPGRSLRRQKQWLVDPYRVACVHLHRQRHGRLFEGGVFEPFPTGLFGDWISSGPPSYRQSRRFYSVVLFLEAVGVRE